MHITKIEVNYDPTENSQQILLDLEEQLGVKLHQNGGNIINGHLNTSFIDGIGVIEICLYDENDIEYINELPEDKKTHGVILEPIEII